MSQLAAWIRWATRCRFGHRCARLRITSSSPPLPPEFRMVAEYVCGGCGRKKRTTF